MDIDDRPFVSVVIPVFNDWDKLALCLSALKKQTYPVQRLEVIVVDNGSEIVGELEEPNGAVSVLSCVKPGSYAARNTGLSASQGQVFAFTDADCIPDRAWVEEGVHKLQDNTDLGIISGGIRIFTSEDSANSLTELFDKVLAFPQEEYAKSNYGVTANLFVRRSVFETVGVFDEERKSGGDANFCRRAVRQGFQLELCPAAIVWHPARKKVKELVQKQRRVVGGRVLHGTLAERLASWFSIITPPMKPIMKVLNASSIRLIDKLRLIGLLFYLWPLRIIEALRVVIGGAAIR